MKVDFQKEYQPSSLGTVITIIIVEVNGRPQIFKELKYPDGTFHYTSDEWFIDGYRKSKKGEKLTIEELLDEDLLENKGLYWQHP